MRRLAKFVAVTLLFSAAYSLWPLYQDNQYLYFVRGSARADRGYLAHDWFVQARDPFPVVSALVWATYRFLPEAAFLLYQALLLGLYAAAALGIGRVVYGLDRDRQKHVAFAALLLAAHSGVLAEAMARLAGLDINASPLIQSGFGGNHLVGRYFQPSSFGILAFVSVYAFVAGRPYLAAVMLGLTVALHWGFALPVATLALAYVVLTLEGARNIGRAVALAAIVGAGFGIAVMYVYPSFRPTSAEAARQAMDIMFRFRIPHHTMVTRWFPLPTAVKFVVILAGLAVTWWRPRVFAILAIPLAVGLGLTIVQIVTGSEFLGLVYPWRVGVVLVPLSATLLIAWSLDRLWPSLSRGAARLVVWSSGLLAVVAVVTGGLLTAAHFTAAAGNPALPMMKFVERTKSPRDVYLIPPNLEEFRFSAGAPTVVDFKAVAIKDTEVLEWYSRIRAVEPVYRTGVLDCPTLGGFKARYGVTHVVWPGSDPSGLCPELRPVYRDAGFAVYRVAER